MVFEEDGTLVTIQKVGEVNFNANEKRLFKIVIVDIPDEEFYTFTDPLVEQTSFEIKNKAGVVIDSVVTRKNKVDVKTITGKEEKIAITDVTQKITPTPTTADTVSK